MTNINYDRRVFRALGSARQGEIAPDAVFHYFHERDGLVWAEYCGGTIVKGMSLAQKKEDGSLDMRYQHVNTRGQFMTGACNSVPEVLADGRYRLRETWQRTSGDFSAGESVLEERSAPFSSAHGKSTFIRGFSITGLC